MASVRCPHQKCVPCAYKIKEQTINSLFQTGMRGSLILDLDRIPDFRRKIDAGTPFWLPPAPWCVSKWAQIPFSFTFCWLPPVPCLFPNGLLMRFGNIGGSQTSCRQVQCLYHSFCWISKRLRLSSFGAYARQWVPTMQLSRLFGPRRACHSARAPHARVANAQANAHPHEREKMKTLRIYVKT